VRLFIGAGRGANIGPGDLVGAIINEAQLSGEAIGAIEIADRFSLVEVRAEHAEAIIHALRGTTLRGRKVVVRRDRES
jgi:ATP-dependent RNA helicase DeaD